MKIIGVSGGIGVGKTTLTKKLCDGQAGWKALIEEPTKFPFIDEYHSNKSSFGFHSRVGILTYFENRRCGAVGKNSHCFHDRLVFETMIFAQIQFEDGFMSAREFDLYKDLYEIICANQTKPDLILYCECPVDVAVDRIVKRSRSFEIGYIREYVARIATAYEEWVTTQTVCKNVVRINTSRNYDLDSLKSKVLGLP